VNLFLLNTSGKTLARLYLPADTAIAADVGIFKYEILESISGTRTSGCVNYEDRFVIELRTRMEALVSAQFCAPSPIWRDWASF
jgi:hypothetical protein